MNRTLLIACSFLIFWSCNPGKHADTGEQPSEYSDRLQRIKMTDLNGQAIDLSDFAG